MELAGPGTVFLSHWDASHCGWSHCSLGPRSLSIDGVFNRSFTIASVSSEIAEALTPRLASLPPLREQRSTAGPTETKATYQDVVRVAQAETQDAGQQAHTDGQVSEQPAAATNDTSQPLLSLMWEQQHLHEWLMSGELN